MTEHIYRGSQFGEEWFTFSDFYAKIVRDAPDPAHFVEVGCWKGRSAAFMVVEILNSGKKIKLDCVDCWGEHSDRVTFLQNMESLAKHITVIHQLSANVATVYRDSTLDFVFLDANHDYANVRADILAWKPKLKPGGILAGHDYASKEAGEVRRAVCELLPGHTEEDGDCWKFVIPK